MVPGGPNLIRILVETFGLYYCKTAEEYEVPQSSCVYYPDYWEQDDLSFRSSWVDSSLKSNYKPKSVEVQLQWNRIKQFIKRRIKSHIYFSDTSFVCRIYLPSRILYNLGQTVLAGMTVSFRSSIKDTSG